MLSGQSDGGNSSTEDPSSQVSLVCVKLANLSRTGTQKSKCQSQSRSDPQNNLLPTSSLGYKARDESHDPSLEQTTPPNCTDSITSLQGAFPLWKQPCHGMIPSREFRASLFLGWTTYSPVSGPVTPKSGCPSDAKVWVPRPSTRVFLHQSNASSV